MKIAFRVDASAMIGTGHLRRCLALAHALSALGAQLRFVTRDLGLDSAGMIAQQGFADIVTLPAPDAPCPSDPAIGPGAANTATQRDRPWPVPFRRRKIKRGMTGRISPMPGISANTMNAAAARRCGLSPDYRLRAQAADNIAPGYRQPAPSDAQRHR